MARTRRKVNPLAPATIATAPQQRIYKVGGYVRLSVEDSGKPGADTIEAQKGLVLEYIEAQPDMEFCGLYCDNGRTGTNFQRPEFERLMDDVRAGKIDCIVVKDLSRFGRNYKETGQYLEQIFPFLDVRFVAVNDNFDTLTAERSQDGYIVPLKNIMNEVYSRDISRKVSSALEVKQQGGKFIGSWAPYGYRKSAEDKHHLEPDPETAPVLKDIFTWRLSGMGYLPIVRRLNELGIPSPSRLHYLRGEVKSERFASAVWHAAIIKKILSDEVYLGHLVQGRTKNDITSGRKLVPVPREQWVIVRNTHQALIDENTFWAVQELAQESRAAHEETLGKFDSLGTIPNILKGLVYCADCKVPMVRYKNVSENCGHRYYVYICRSHMENPARCPKKSLHETRLLDILWETLQDEIRLAGGMGKLANEFNHSPAVMERKEALACEIQKARKALSRLHLLYDSLYQNYVDKLMDEREYLEMKKHYQVEIRREQARVEDLERQKAMYIRQALQNPWLDTCSKFTGAAELTEEMAHALIERIEVGADNRVSIKLRYQDERASSMELLASAGKAVAI